MKTGICYCSKNTGRFKQRENIVFLSFLSKMLLFKCEQEQDICSAFSFTFSLDLSFFFNRRKLSRKKKLRIIFIYLQELWERLFFPRKNAKMHFKNVEVLSLKCRTHNVWGNICSRDCVLLVYEWCYNQLGIMENISFWLKPSTSSNTNNNIIPS